MREPTKKQTVLPYVLGGHDDPHFQDLSSKDVDAARTEGYLTPAAGLPSRVDALPAQPPAEDIGGNWTPDRVQANEDIYGNGDDYWSLHDEGRSFGEGESYGERNA